MIKTQKNSATLDQLRGLMRRHADTQVDAQPRQVSVAAVSVSQVTRPVPMPAQPPAPKAIVHERFTVRLNAPELAKLGDIVLATHQRTGQRITPTDVLRVGLGRVGESSPITAAEISALRATDARRHRPETLRPQDQPATI